MNDNQTNTAQSDAIEAYGADQNVQPSDHLRTFERFIGTWQVTGGAEGTVRYEWMTGGFFLIQNVELVQYGQNVTGTEIIGHLHPFGEPVSDEISSRFYDAQGNTFDYVHELDGDVYTIWAGAKGSPAFFRGTFADNDTTMSGEWTYPGGGGYSSTMTRVSAG